MFFKSVSEPLTSQLDPPSATNLKIDEMREARCASVAEVVATDTKEAAVCATRGCERSKAAASSQLCEDGFLCG